MSPLFQYVIRAIEKRPATVHMHATRKHLTETKEI